MNDRLIQIQLGVGAVIAAALFLLLIIPALVSTPSNVPNIILSPLFWPNTLASLTGLIGIGMLMTALRLKKPEATAESDVDNRRAAFVRLLAFAVVMLFMIYAMPRLGLVWASMVAFIATAVLVRTRNPLAAVISAILVPLTLYIFFAHVAGVAIPQGDFVRLP